VLLGRLRGAGMTRGVSCFAAILALVLQLALPLADDPVGRSALGPWSGFPLCHARGAVDQPANHSLPSAPSRCALCPLCLALQAAGTFVAPPRPADLLAAAAQPLRLSFPSATVSAPRSAGVLAQPRAPPVLA